ncbi:uncharacterized protein TNCV_3938611 [Trichonephila clavipes]|nr:uncharacterized protein TNCV_3938611 [Trichonephila clavipes]
MKRKENFQWLPKELHQLKYEAISVPQGSVRFVKQTQERKSSNCYLLITKGVTSSSPVPLKTRRERERRYTCHLNVTMGYNLWTLNYGQKVKIPYLVDGSLTSITLISQTWPWTLRDEEALGIFKGIQVNVSWRRSYLQLYKIYLLPDIVKFSKIQRLKWTGPLARMNEDRCYKKIFLAKPMGPKAMIVSKKT